VTLRLRKFKSPILGGKRALLCFFLFKKEDGGGKRVFVIYYGQVTVNVLTSISVNPNFTRSSIILFNCQV